MRGHRFGETRTWFQSRPSARNREHSRRDVEGRRSRFDSGAADSEGGRRGGGLVERGGYERLGIDGVERRDCDNKGFDGDREGQLRELSRFNEGLSRGESASMKFQWKQLLGEGVNSNGGEKCERDYQRSRFSDLERPEMVVRKLVSMEDEMCPLKVGPVNVSGHVDRRMLSPLGNLNVGLHKNEDVWSRDHTCVDNVSARELYKEADMGRLYSKDGSGHLTPSFQYNSVSTMSSGIARDELLGGYNDVLRIPSDGLSRTYEMLTAPIASNGYGHRTLIELSTKTELQVKNVMDYQRPQHSPSESKPRDYACPEARRTEWGDLAAVSDGFYGKIASVREDYGHQGSVRASIVDPIIDKIESSGSSYRDHLRDSSLLENHHFLQEHIISKYHDAPGASYQSKQDEEILGSRSTHLEFGTEVYQGRDSLLGTELYQGRDSLRGTEVYQEHDNLRGTEVHQEHESLPLEDDYGLGREGGHPSYEEILNRLPTSEYDPGMYGIVGSPPQRLTSEEIGLHDPSEKLLKRKHNMDKKSNRHKPESKMLSDWNTSHDIHVPSDGNGWLTPEDVECSVLSNKSNQSQYKKARRAFDEITFEEMGSYKISNSDDCLSSHSLSACTQRHLSKPHRSSRNLPASTQSHLRKPHRSSRNLSASAQGHLSKVRNSAGRDIKTRLRPCPQNSHNLNSTVRKCKADKFPRTRLDGFHGSLHPQWAYPSKIKTISVKTDPTEDSEEFKQLVHCTFLKCVKHLNESSAQRRRYTEQGKAGSLKCSVCGSNSKDFVDTQSLATHAFKSLKVGLKAQHLGFHKALCTLMGWNSAVGLNGSWILRVLPDAEALALKEDLIIWPPVVIIHNSSIANNDPDERIIITIEMLETILKDMGFGGGMTKVCRGKPANQSIMVVKFNGTFSGMQEAEKLHKFYADIKQGKAEFLLQIGSNSGNNRSGESRKGLADKPEHVLYGYLGIAWDLDKLDFETKKWSVVKSKKEIQAIADATLKTE